MFRVKGTCLGLGFRIDVRVKVSVRVVVLNIKWTEKKV